MKKVIKVMKIVVKEYVYFTKKDRDSFKNWLTENNMTLTEYAQKCKLTKSFIYFLIKGQRSFTKKSIEKFESGGYKLNLK